MVSALSKLPDGTIELTITIPWQRVKTAYNEALDNLAKKAEIKGFRKGKAPKKVVEQKTDKNQLYEAALKALIPQAYVEAVKEQKVKPIISPQIQVISLQENKDWQIKALTCELPEINLGDYKAKLQKDLAPEKIWTPGKEEKPKEENRENRVAKILKALAENINFKIPEILIEQEVNRMLTRLLDQTNQLGLTVEQYLTSTEKTQEQLRNEYRRQAEETLKLEFILAKIADEQKVSVSDEEVQKMIAAVPDEKTKKGLGTPEQKLYIQQLLRKRKVIDNLTKL